MAGTSGTAAVAGRIQESRHVVRPFDVRMWSGGEGQPLLYLHGFEWHPGPAPFLDRLAAGRRVYAPEHPGFGESTGIDQIDDMLDIVLYYRRVVESLGVDQIDVIGHSLGGMIAAEFAAICPHLVRRLVLVDSYGLWQDDRQLPDLFVFPEPELAQVKWHDPSKAPDPESPTQARDPEDPTVAQHARMENLAAAGKFMWPIPDRGLRKRLPLIAAPTLVVHGESDGLIPLSYSEELAGTIADARLVKISEAGHLPMLEREDAFLEAVEAFLEG